MILVDTSVWVEHFRRGKTRLPGLLDEEEVLSHPFIVGELACGNLRNRGEILGLLGALPCAPIAGHREVLHLLDSARLYGRGLGWIDLHLLASAMITSCSLWTLDRSLQRAAASLRVLA